MSAPQAASGPQARHTWAGAGLLVVVVVLVLVASDAVAPGSFWPAWLVACWWCLGPVLGGAAALGIHRLTGGLWGEVLAPAVGALAARLPWVLLLFLPLLVPVLWPGTTARPDLYPWAVQDGGTWAHGLSRPAFKLAWFSTPFFLARVLVYAAIALWLVRPAALRRLGQGRAALSLIVYLLLGSLAAIDAVGSLLPRWHSSVFGLALLAGQLLAGVAAATWLTARAVAAGQLAVPVPAAGKPPVWRDLGNLLLMAVMLWAYLAFMQFLVIWAENLPEEIAWFVPRLMTGWRFGGLALVLLQFALPLALLLFRAVKDRPARLGWVAALALFAQMLDAAWLVLPSVAPHDAAAAALVPLLAVALGLLVFGGVPGAMAQLAAGISTEAPHGPR